MIRISAANISELRQSLIEAKAWCALKAAQSIDPDTTAADGISPSDQHTLIHPARYWTRELDPQLDNDCSIYPSVPDLHRAIVAVRARRKLLLDNKQQTLNQLCAPEQVKGSLLRCRFQDCFFDHAPNLLSGGFFDNGDFPPWDTWIGYATESNSEGFPNPRSELVCWIPFPWFHIVSRGINGSPTFTNQWEEEINDGLTEQLREHGLLN